jgi:hypothetical protein
VGHRLVLHAASPVFAAQIERWDSCASDAGDAPKPAKRSQRGSTPTAGQQQQQEQQQQQQQEQRCR